MRDWKSSNDLINQVELAQTALESQAGLDDPHVLFETGKELTLAANHILNLLNQSTVTDEEIKTAYEKLPIKSSADIRRLQELHQGQVNPLEPLKFAYRPFHPSA